MKTYDVVAKGFECPKCGEDCVDKLSNNDGIITCAVCGCVYNLGEM